MSHYNHVPFTSNLQMWSPSSSPVSLDLNITAFLDSTAVSTQTAAKYYHHEPLFYPAACIICGLFHHPAPHTMMNSLIQQPSSATTEIAVGTATITRITPAPSTSSVPIIPLGREKRTKYPNTTRKLRSRLLQYFEIIYNRFTFIFKMPFRKRHNIYPLKRHE